MMKRCIYAVLLVLVFASASIDAACKNGQCSKRKKGTSRSARRQEGAAPRASRSAQRSAPSRKSAVAQSASPMASHSDFMESQHQFRLALQEQRMEDAQAYLNTLKKLGKGRERAVAVWQKAYNETASLEAGHSNSYSEDVYAFIFGKGAKKAAMEEQVEAEEPTEEEAE